MRRGKLLVRVIARISRTVHKPNLWRAFAFSRAMDDDGGMLSHDSDPLSEPVPGVPRPDPGSRGMAMGSGVLALGLLIVIFFTQQGKVESHSQPQAQADRAISPLDPDQVKLKVILKLTHLLGQTNQDPKLTERMKQFLDQESSLDQGAITPRQELWTAMGAAELIGTPDAYTRLQKLNNKLSAVKIGGQISDTLEALKSVVSPKRGAAEKGEPTEVASKEEEQKKLAQVRQVLADIQPLMKAYSTSAADLDAPTRDGIIARNGWIGKVAMTTGQAYDSPERQELLGGGAALIAIGIAAALALLLGVPTSLSLFIIAIVKVSGGKVRWRFDRPATGGSVYLESLAVFFAAFLGVGLLGSAIAQARGLNEDQAPQLRLSLQWLLILVPLWPLVRGVSFSRLRADLGLHTGEGLFKEIGCGIFGFLAGAPVFVLGVLLTLVLVVIRETIRSRMGTTEQGGLPSNPIVDLISSKGLVLFLVVVLATIWAPLVEESVFRGGLFRHLRSRWWAPAAAMGTAMAFGLVHSYDWIMLSPIIGLGFNFALMREWRGSLIAPMTAHFLHNGMQLAFAISLLKAIGD